MQGLNVTGDAAAAHVGGRPSLSVRRVALQALRLLVATASVAIFAGCLAIAGLSYAGYKSAPVLSGSMSNIMPVGSLVIVKSVSATRVHVGDVVMFRAPGYYGHYTHRIHSIGGTPANRVFITKGDMNKAPDPWRLHSINGQGHFGKFVADVPYVGYFVEYTHDWRARLALLLAACISAGVVLLRRIWEPRESNA